MGYEGRAGRWISLGSLAMVSCSGPKSETPGQGSVVLVAPPSASSVVTAAVPSASVSAASHEPASSGCGSAADCAEGERCCEADAGGVCQIDACAFSERCTASNPVCKAGFKCVPKSYPEGEHRCEFVNKKMACGKSVCSGEKNRCSLGSGGATWGCSSPTSGEVPYLECATNADCGPGYQCCAASGFTTCVGPGGCDFMNWHTVVCKTDKDCPGPILTDDAGNVIWIADSCTPIHNAPPNFKECPMRPGP